MDLNVRLIYLYMCRPAYQYLGQQTIIYTCAWVLKTMTTERYFVEQEYRGFPSLRKYV